MAYAIPSTGRCLAQSECMSYTSAMRCSGTERASMVLPGILASYEQLQGTAQMPGELRCAMSGTDMQHSGTDRQHRYLTYRH